LSKGEGHALHATACGEECEEKQKHDEGCKKKRKDFKITDD